MSRLLLVPRPIRRTGAPYHVSLQGSAVRIRGCTHQGIVSKSETHLQLLSLRRRRKQTDSRRNCASFVGRVCLCFVPLEFKLLSLQPRPVHPSPASPTRLDQPATVIRCSAKQLGCFVASGTGTGTETETRFPGTRRHGEGWLPFCLFVCLSVCLSVCPLQLSSKPTAGQCV